ncbi:MAG: bifunctional phosphoribosyl-AMP cyclohydrolase/phosphoribosyl-ATP diphosphatase HisIE [Vulcanimicrobiaceae bacterium]
MDIEGLIFNDAGLLPVVIADATSGEVLSLAWADRAAIERTVATRETHLYSRSRNAPWRKGESSGHTQRVLEVVADCDGDAILYRVDPHGPACHTGASSCFHHSLLPLDGADPAALARALAHLQRIAGERKIDPPAGSYIAQLFAGGVDRIGKKIGEEATEVVIAAKNADENELVWEAADLLFHLVVMLEARNVALARVGEHLLTRAKPKDA